MSKLSTEAKQAIAEKVLARDGRTVKEIAEAHNVGYSTLSKWVRKSLNGVIINSEKHVKNSQVLSLSERFQHLMATASPDETTTGIYCRKNGLQDQRKMVKRVPINKLTQEQRNMVISTANNTTYRDFIGIATRYCKRGEYFIGAVKLASCIILMC